MRKTRIHLIEGFRQGTASAVPQRCNRHRHPEGAQRPKDLLLQRRLYVARIYFLGGRSFSSDIKCLNLERL